MRAARAGGRAAFLRESREEKDRQSGGGEAKEKGFWGSICRQTDQYVGRLKGGKVEQRE